MENVKSGDIVVFYDSELLVLVMHRVASISTDKAFITTKDDTNAT